jgi:hypothetical protein
MNTTLAQVVAAHVLVSQQELVDMLESHKGAVCISMFSRTMPKMTVKSRVTGEPNPHKAGVIRLAYRRAMIGVNYEAGVNRERTNEGEVPDFVAESLWNGAGERAGQYFARHKVTGKLYLVVRPEQKTNDDTEIGKSAPVIADRWIDAATMKEVDPDTLADYLPVPSKSGKQGVAHDLLWRCYALDSIQSVTVDGTTYQVA